MNQLADFDRLSAVCAWINTLPVYMFSGELTAALLLLAYEEDDLDVVDPVSYTHLTLPTIYSV